MRPTEGQRAGGERPVQSAPCSCEGRSPVPPSMDHRTARTRLLPSQEHGRLMAGPPRPQSKSEEHTSQPPSLMRTSYAVFRFHKKIIHTYSTSLTYHLSH